VLLEIPKLEGKYAFAGLPCQIHGLRVMQEIEPAFKQKVPYIVGLFCGGALEPYLVPELLRMKSISPSMLQDFQFRGGDWPGKMRAVLKDGRIVNMHYSDYKDGAYNYLTYLYSPVRCTTCTDGSAHFADVAVGDVWTRNTQGQYAFAAQSRMLMRTEVGTAIVKNAVRRGTVVAEDVSKDPSYKTHKAATKRKGMTAPLRIARWKAKGIQVPIYDRDYNTDASFAERFAERFSSAVQSAAKWRLFRIFTAALLTSSFAIPLICLRRLRKKWKYRASKAR